MPRSIEFGVQVCGLTFFSHLLFNREGLWHRDLDVVGHRLEYLHGIRLVDGDLDFVGNGFLYWVWNMLLDNDLVGLGHMDWVGLVDRYLDLIRHLRTTSAKYIIRIEVVVSMPMNRKIMSSALLPSFLRCMVVEPALQP